MKNKETKTEKKDVRKKKKRIFGRKKKRTFRRMKISSSEEGKKNDRLE